MNAEIVINNVRKANIFCEILKKLKTFTESITLMVNDERVFIQGMDASHITIFEVTLQKKWFTLLQVSGGENKEFSMNTTILSKVLAIKTEHQTLRFYNTNDTMDKLSIDMCSNNNDEYDKFFEVPLVDLDTELMSIPHTEYDATIQMKSKHFKTIIDGFCQFEFNDVTIECLENTVYFKTDSSEGTMKTQIQDEQLLTYAVIEDSQVVNHFNLNFLSKMCQFIKISDTVLVQQSKGIPIEIRYSIEDNENDIIPNENVNDNDTTQKSDVDTCDESDISEQNYLRFYLAPSIGMDDDDEL